ncbi:tRNA pseudouridine(38-40) synthase TruA [Desulfolucanica intricata]|uniref:tRNA pseudouridine(38-40) synthase TruA n=1 Tax=Desulfolucanica intricata TaxID=1285191 RepID=UPI000B2C3C0D|nr:tRNA pseudouridine(38-40) synthase TruA [Desulfolucanica intricata]
MRNIKVTIAYDGTNYHGFQEQRGTRLPTIQGVLQQELSRLSKNEIIVTAAGRTDAGVHAKGQVINFVADKWQIPIDRVVPALNSVLPKDICALAAEEVDPFFHARFAAVAKTYKYYIYNDIVPSPFWRLYSYHYKGYLDLEQMQKAAAYLIGEHDFCSFMAAGSPVKSTVRTLYELKLERKDKLIVLSFHGNGFLYNMVRIITGTLIEVGIGKYGPGDLKQILEGRNRKLAGPTAAASGLFLEKVYY